MDRLTQQRLKKGSEETRNTLAILLKHYTALLSFIKDKQCYFYHIQKYATYIEHAALQNADPPADHKIPYMAQHGAEYHHYYTQVKAGLAWWAQHSTQLTTQVTALQTQSNITHSTPYSIEHIIQCFKVVEYEWDVWHQIEQYLYPNINEPSQKNRGETIATSNYYCLVAKLAYHHQSIKELFEWHNPDFIKFLTQYVHQCLTQAIDEYVTLYHQSQPNDAFWRTTPLTPTDTLVSDILANIAHITYYWPFPDLLQHETKTTAEHIEAKQTLLAITHDLQQRFLKKILLKDPTNRVHPWLLADFTFELMRYMTNYASTHNPLSLRFSMISVGFFTPESPSAQSKSDPRSTLLSPTFSTLSNHTDFEF